MMNLFVDDLKARIASAYANSGNQLGWRLLYSPESVLSKAEVAFVGLNPGGAKPEPDVFSMNIGSAYRDEIWWGGAPGCSPLQKQVQKIFDRMGLNPEDVLAGNLVPFRSPDWRSLNRKDDALAFGRELWRDIFRAARPRVVIAMGGLVRDELAGLLEVKTLRRISTGWGSVSATRGEANGVTFIGLPHLSRFRIMGRNKSQSCINELFGGKPANCGIAGIDAELDQ